MLAVDQPQRRAMRLQVLGEKGQGLVARRDIFGQVLSSGVQKLKNSDRHYF